MLCQYLLPDCCRNYTIIGKRGRIENYGDYGGICQVHILTRRIDRFDMEGDITCRMPEPGEGHGVADQIIIDSFINMIRTNEVPSSIPQEA